MWFYHGTESSAQTHLFELFDYADSVSQQDIAVAAVLRPSSSSGATMMAVVHPDTWRKHTDMGFRVSSITAVGSKRNDREKQEQVKC